MIPLNADSGNSVFATNPVAQRTKEATPAPKAEPKAKAKAKATVKTKRNPIIIIIQIPRTRKDRKVKAPTDQINPVEAVEFPRRKKFKI